MKVMSGKDFENKFGISESQINEWEEQASNGVYQGEPCGEILVGRPLMFGEEMQQVGFKEPISVVKAIDKRAEQLGKKRSAYLRDLVEADLHKAGVA